jgi:hypothetical protein
MFHALAYYVRKVPGLDRIGRRIFDIGEGYEDAASPRRDFPHGRRALHRFYRGLGWTRLVCYSLGYVLGSARLDLIDG